MRSSTCSLIALLCVAVFSQQVLSEDFLRGSELSHSHTKALKGSHSSSNNDDAEPTKAAGESAEARRSVSLSFIFDQKPDKFKVAESVTIEAVTEAIGVPQGSLLVVAVEEFNRGKDTEVKVVLVPSDSYKQDDILQKMKTMAEAENAHFVSVGLIAIKLEKAEDKAEGEDDDETVDRYGRPVDTAEYWYVGENDHEYGFEPPPENLVIVCIVLAVCLVFISCFMAYYIKVREPEKTRKLPRQPSLRNLVPMQHDPKYKNMEGKVKQMETERLHQQREMDNLRDKADKLKEMEKDRIQLMFEMTDLRDRAEKGDRVPTLEKMITKLESEKIKLQVEMSEMRLVMRSPRPSMSPTRASDAAPPSPSSPDVAALEKKKAGLQSECRDLTKKKEELTEELEGLQSKIEAIKQYLLKFEALKRQQQHTGDDDTTEATTEVTETESDDDEDESAAVAASEEALLRKESSTGHYADVEPRERDPAHNPEVELNKEQSTGGIADAEESPRERPVVPSLKISGAGSQQRSPPTRKSAVGAAAAATGSDAVSFEVYDKNAGTFTKIDSPRSSFASGSAPSSQPAAITAATAGHSAGTDDGPTYEVYSKTSDQFATMSPRTSTSATTAPVVTVGSAGQPATDGSEPTYEVYRKGSNTYEKMSPRSPRLSAVSQSSPRKSPLSHDHSSEPTYEVYDASRGSFSIESPRTRGSTSEAPTETQGLLSEEKKQKKSAAPAPVVESKEKEKDKEEEEPQESTEKVTEKTPLQRQPSKKKKKKKNIGGKK
eukprot:GFYU01000947.1.p1 GENE.GFYU01000947.1~~GFYU01000947.1.p1  ORF type:complete len:774 (+),score=222.29 GFYU01000947.1:158-2479(+)